MKKAVPKAGTPEYEAEMIKLRKAQDAAEQRRMRKTFLIKSAESEIYKDIEDGIRKLRGVRK